MLVSIWISSLCAHQPQVPMSISLKYLFPPTCTIDFRVSFVQNTHLDLEDSDLFAYVPFCHQDVTVPPNEAALFLRLTFSSRFFLEQMSDRGSHDMTGERERCPPRRSRLFISEATATWPVVAPRNVPAETRFAFPPEVLFSNTRLHPVPRGCADIRHFRNCFRIKDWRDGDSMNDGVFFFNSTTWQPGREQHC